MRKEVKWGIFVSSGILILLIIFVLFGEFRFFEKGYNIFVTYNFTNGLDKNAPVRLSGVNVGTVEDVSMEYDNEGKIHIIVKLWIKDDVRLREDARFYINTLGLLGEKYIEISPGTAGAETIAENITIVGIDPLSTEELFVKGNEIADNLRSIMNQLNALISGETVEILMNTMKSVTSAMQSTDMLIRENRQNIRTFTGNLSKSSEKLPGITENIGKASEEIEQAFHGRGDDLARIIERLEKFSESLEGLSESLKMIDQGIKEGKGNLGLLVRDDMLYRNLEKTVQEMRELIHDMRENPKKYIKLTVF